MGTFQRVGQIGVGGRTVTQGPENKLGILIDVDGVGRFPQFGGVAVGVALFVGIAHITGGIGAVHDIVKGSGAGIGQRGFLLTQHADEHDQRLQAGGRQLQIEAAAEGGEAAAEEVHGLQRGGHGIVVDGIGVAEAVISHVVHHGGGGGNGEQGSGIFGHHVAVIHGQDGAAGDSLTGGDIHHGTGVKGDLHITGQSQNTKTGGTIEDIAGLETGLLPHIGALHVAGGTQSSQLGGSLIVQGAVGIVEPFFYGGIYTVAVGTGEVAEGDQRVGGIAGCHGSDEECGQRQCDGGDDSVLLHEGSFPLRGWRYGS